MRIPTLCLPVVMPLLAALLSACSPSNASDLVGTWTGRASGITKNEGEIKLALAADKSCVLEFSDRTPPHAFNTYLRTNKIVVTGSWHVEKGQGGDKLLINGMISEWTLTVDPTSNEPLIHKIDPKPLDEDISFVIYPDGTLQTALLNFTAESTSGRSMVAQVGPVVTLSKQSAQ